jgi:hypothetical protein
LSGGGGNQKIKSMFVIEKISHHNTKISPNVDVGAGVLATKLFVDKETLIGKRQKQIESLPQEKDVIGKIVGTDNVLFPISKVHLFTRTSNAVYIVNEVGLWKIQKI